jgi:hypothetical protein
LWAAKAFFWTATAASSIWAGRSPRQPVKAAIEGRHELRHLLYMPWRQTWAPIGGQKPRRSTVSGCQRRTPRHTSLR